MMPAPRTPHSAQLARPLPHFPPLHFWQARTEPPMSRSGGAHELSRRRPSRRRPSRRRPSRRRPWRRRPTRCRPSRRGPSRAPPPIAPPWRPSRRRVWLWVCVWRGAVVVAGVGRSHQLPARVGCSLVNLYASMKIVLWAFVYTRYCKFSVTALTALSHAQHNASRTQLCTHQPTRLCCYRRRLFTINNKQRCAAETAPMARNVHHRDRARALLNCA